MQSGRSCGITAVHLSVRINEENVSTRLQAYVDEMELNEAA